MQFNVEFMVLLVTTSTLLRPRTVRAPVLVASGAICGSAKMRPSGRLRTFPPCQVRLYWYWEVVPTDLFHRITIAAPRGKVAPRLIQSFSTKSETR